MKIWKNAVLFYLGGCAYMALELLWRGRTHGSMFVAGGLCFVLLGRLNRVAQPLPVAVRWLLGSAVITTVELAVGLAVNRNYAVWDYRHHPGNLMGQICPLFSLLWIPMSAVAMVAYDWLNGQLSASFLPKARP